MCSGSQATPTASGGTHSVRCRLQPPLPLLLLRAKTLSLRLITTQNVSKAIVSFTITLSQITHWSRSHSSLSVWEPQQCACYPAVRLPQRLLPVGLPFRHWSTGWCWALYNTHPKATYCTLRTRVTHTYSLAVVRSVCVVSVITVHVRVGVVCCDIWRGCKPGHPLQERPYEFDSPLT